MISETPRPTTYIVFKFDRRMGEHISRRSAIESAVELGATKVIAKIPLPSLAHEDRFKSETIWTNKPKSQLSKNFNPEPGPIPGPETNQTQPEKEADDHE